MAFADNLWELLRFEYDPTLLSRLGGCVDYVGAVPFRPGHLESWGAGLRHYRAESGDPRTAGYLKTVGDTIPQAAGTGDLPPTFNILRELSAALGDAARHEETQKLIRAFEAKADQVLANAMPDDGRLTWQKFCDYVFAAGKPVIRGLAPPAKKAKTPPSPPKP